MQSFLTRVISNARVKRRAGLQITAAITSLLCLGAHSTSMAQVEGLPAIGEVIWEDNFDSLNTDFWSIDQGDGCQYGANLCGWGNWELQWYAPENVSIQPVPGESGNNALVLEARREASNGYSFTSGKLTSQNKIAVQYGVVEARINVPSVDTGLWPAFWMLGTNPQPWPRKGEIDIMEMGHMQAERTRQGHPDADIDAYVGSNLIFYADAACADVNPTCAASTAWDVDYNKPYVGASALTGRFITYRMYWTETQIAFTLIDDGVETMLYEAPFTIGEESTEFQAPFYLLLNLAVGGTFTDAASPAAVSATMPAPMLVDYVRVYQADGQGEILAGDQSPPPKQGPFGVFTDNTPVNDSLVIGVDSDIYLWDPFSDGGTAEPFEGDNVISFAYNTPGNWFGAGISAFTQPDMSGYSDGELRFNIKIPADVSFRIGVTDNYTNENWITFPANESLYGLERNGEWGEVRIPISDLRGTLIALQNMNYLFAISSAPGAFPTQAFEYAIDNIVWDDGNLVDPDSDGDGVSDSNDQCPGTPANTPVDEQGCALPLDSDNDGVIDDLDQCPDTAPGAIVDEYGCAIPVSDEVATGTVTFAQNHRLQWTHVAFDTPFEAPPIVVAGAPTANGEKPVTVRISNITTHGFDIQMSEWQYQNGKHKEETVSYMAVERGVQYWGDVQVVAGEAEINHEWNSLNFSTQFDAAPVVLASQVSINGKQTAAIRMQNINAQGFDIRLQEEEKSNGKHKIETVHFLALTHNVIGQVNGQDIYAGRTHTYVHDQWTGYNLVPGGFMVDPLFMAGLQTFNDAEPVALRYRGLAWNQVKLLAQEEKSLDAETKHKSEVAGYFVLGRFAWADYDHDGVLYNEDLCPGTPRGVTVDENGCEIIVPVDTDGDGVTDDLDQCPDTLPGTPVDDLGCALPLDSDGDGIIDDLDLCPGTPAGVNVDSDGCEVVEGVTGINRTGDTSAVFYVNSSDWADVHYIVNDGPQLNVRMQQMGDRNEFVVTGLNAGDSISFSFTYWYPEGPWAEVTDWENYTH